MMAWYDAALDRIQVPLQTHCLPTRHGETHVVTAGSTTAGAVVLLHGVNINAAVWQPQLESLASTHYVIAPDVPGFAGRGSANRINYRDTSLAHWLADVLDALRVERAVIAGGSAGGWFALKFAAHYPQRTAAALIMNPCGITPYRGVYKLTRVTPAIHFLRIFRPIIAHPAIARHVVERGMNPNTPATPENIELAYLLLKYYRRRSPPPIMPDAELCRITSPVTLLTGEHEVYITPHKVQARMRRLVPQTVIKEIPGVGHDINKEAPELVNATLRHLSEQHLHPQRASNFTVDVVK
ncbi:MAG: alpha/beta hydrolase [Chloroflexota bacterium]